MCPKSCKGALHMPSKVLCPASVLVVKNEPSSAVNVVHPPANRLSNLRRYLCYCLPLAVPCPKAMGKPLDQSIQIFGL